MSLIGGQRGKERRHPWGRRRVGGKANDAINARADDYRRGPTLHTVASFSTTDSQGTKPFFAFLDSPHYAILSYVTCCVNICYDCGDKDSGTFMKTSQHEFRKIRVLSILIGDQCVKVLSVFISSHGLLVRSECDLFSFLPFHVWKQGPSTMLFRHCDADYD